jgi:hypothetical protein
VRGCLVQQLTTVACPLPNGRDLGYAVLGLAPTGNWTSMLYLKLVACFRNKEVGDNSKLSTKSYCVHCFEESSDLLTQIDELISSGFFQFTDCSTSTLQLIRHHAVLHWTHRRPATSLAACCYVISLCCGLQTGHTCLMSAARYGLVRLGF